MEADPGSPADPGNPANPGPRDDKGMEGLPTGPVVKLRTPVDETEEIPYKQIYFRFKLLSYI